MNRSRLHELMYRSDLPPLRAPGNALDRHNLLCRHLKKAARELGLPREIDFRSFRTMHASLVRRMGGRLEVARDNMGHAGNTGLITLDVYSKSWWKERVDAVTRVVEAVFTEPEEKKKGEEEKNTVTSSEHLRKLGGDGNWVPFWVPQPMKPDQI